MGYLGGSGRGQAAAAAISLHSGGKNAVAVRALGALMEVRACANGPSTVTALQCCVMEPQALKIAVPSTFYLMLSAEPWSEHHWPFTGSAGWKRNLGIYVLTGDLRLDFSLFTHERFSNKPCEYNSVPSKYHGCVKRHDERVVPATSTAINGGVAASVSVEDE